MHDWNVVVSVHEDGYRAAVHLLSGLGKVARTDFYNVLVMRVDDPAAFLDRLAALVEETPGILNDISRVVPSEEGFGFQSAEEFESKARDVVLAWVPELANCSFHVRMHRRGFKHAIRSPGEERFLDEVLLTALEEAGTPGRITFEDPDAVIAVETVGARAGLSFWRRADLGRYPFLGLD